MEVNGKIYISNRHTKDDYIKLNLESNSSEEDWEKAIDIFKDRIESRFLKPIELLLNNEDEGMQCEFSALSIMTFLIETFKQFRDGIVIEKKIETFKQVRNGTAVEKRIEKLIYKDENNQSKDYITTDIYTDFLSIKPFFLIRDEAELFYTNVRCGLLHQAELKDNVVIYKNVNNCLDFKNQKNFYINIDSKDSSEIDNPQTKKLNIWGIFNLLKEYFDIYSAELESNQKLRKNFIRKMNSIVEKIR